MSTADGETGEIVFEGKVASPGLVTGVLAVQTQDRSPDRVSRPAGDERAALAAALAEATVQLQELAGRADAMASEILEFQIALLEDDALIEPALEKIDAAVPRSYPQQLPNLSTHVRIFIPISQILLFNTFPICHSSFR